MAKNPSMKSFTLTLAVFFAALSITLAGPERYSGKEVVQQAPPPANWCFQGWYFGVHGGVTCSNFNTSTSADEDSLGANGAGFVFASDSSSGDEGASAQGGLHAGYNWQHGGWIYGFEADISATALDQIDDAVAFTFLPNGPPFVTGVSAKSTVNWYSTARMRFGHTLGERVFLYGTGGLAFGQAELKQNTGIFALRFDNQGNTLIDRNGGFASDEGIKFGWTAGAGIDFCLTPHVILGFTYLYVDLADSDASNSISFLGSGPPRQFNSQTNSSSDNNFHVFQANLSFHF